MIGVIGGMGPLATADFFQKVIECSAAFDGAQHDEDHVPLLISSDPRIPRRPAALLSGGPSPLPALLARRDQLLAAGATALVMPCNTAHAWHADLLQACKVPFPSIIDVACDAARASVRPGVGGAVGIIATRATLAANLFTSALERRGLQALPPSDDLLDECILPSIAAVKAGQVDAARASMVRAVQALLGQGAERVVLACTEAPIAMQGAPSAMLQGCIDTTFELARHTVSLWRQASGPRPAS